jgi:pilus assembly protein CpaF
MTLTTQHPSSRSPKPDLEKIKVYLVNSLTRELEENPPPLNRRREFITQKLNQVYGQTQLKLADTLRQQVFRDVLDDLLGYGPIQPLLDDHNITEVMVNGPFQVYTERNGKLTLTNVKFEDDDHVLRIIERIILPLGRRIDADSPTVDARLPDGSRVNAVIPPVAIDGPSITIRKFFKEKLTINQLIELGSITKKMAEFLRACVVSRLNIVISGGTGSGKTTTLNILSGFIPKDRLCSCLFSTVWYAG